MAGRIHTLTSLEHVAQDDFINLVRFEVSPLQRCPDTNSAQLCSRYFCQPAAICANRSTNRTDDYRFLQFSHKLFSLMEPLEPASTPPTLSSPQPLTPTIPPPS